MDRWHGDEHLEVLTASPREVGEVMQTIHAWDSDGHNSHWWAARLMEADLFRDLDVFDAEHMLRAVMRSGDSQIARLQQKILEAVKTELDG
ncbi:hypothetical protein [Achromobacter marplatensis]|uniref:hypothetical protein n=1 Tax=Achromobacter marplatensis TaxID=470868 RepID=UPI003C70EC4E